MRMLMRMLIIVNAGDERMCFVVSSCRIHFRFIWVVSKNVAKWKIVEGGKYGGVSCGTDVTPFFSRRRTDMP